MSLSFFLLPVESLGGKVDDLRYDLIFFAFPARGSLELALFDNAVTDPEGQLLLCCLNGDRQCLSNEISRY